MSEDKNIKNVETNKSVVDLSRRRFAKAGLIAAPILSTLPGKSAFASSANIANNCTVSGNLSGNLSKDTTTDPCEFGYKGRTPGYWKNHPYQWGAVGADIFPNRCVDEMGHGGHSACNNFDFKESDFEDEKYDEYYTSTNYPSHFPTDFGLYFGEGAMVEFSCSQILWFYEPGDNTSMHALRGHVVAAYLNAWESGATGNFPYTPLEIVGYYQDFLSGTLGMSQSDFIAILDTLNNMGGYDE